jgi:NAD(P)-dependent dehydrogenase (short-subunit alcohol dehydrogenase family)
MRTWFITGANRGLGLEMVRAALEAGDQVVATARKPDHMETTFNQPDGRLLALPLDVTSDASVKTAVDAAVSRFDRIDVLVNNAGYGQLGAFEELSPQAVQRQFATNVFGVFAVTRTVLPFMRARRSGHILTVSSTAGLIGYGGASVYSATKFALEGWSESLKAELHQFGIRTTLIEPGQFRTDFLDASSVAHGDIAITDYHEYREQRKTGLTKANHMQAGDPVKLGRAVVSLIGSPNPPVRFAAGSEAFGVITNRANMLSEQAEAWRQLSLSLDINE